ncbi:MAG TPA: acyl-ACP--UDP-N-acetylglucosamine O-acyltransferase [Bdellovibrionales bacterium]|nr:acyl-ACP--UDP-N-acetylglucosamine O-acyltransferase [Bdellovibrionales bacterium]
MSIHPSSVISKDAEIGQNVSIGPFCVIQGKVKIGDGTKLVSHVMLGHEHGVVELGKDNVLHAGAAVGGPPQDLSYKGEPTKLIIGDRNSIREFATLNCGTPKGGGVTRVGSDCLIMSYSHIAHDCTLGNHVVIANVGQLAGHVTLEDHVKVGGICAFNQFVRVGKYAFIAGDSAVNKDILPFTISQGKYAVMRATNSIGLDRAGFAKEDIESVNRAIRIITKGGGTIEQSLARIETECAMTESVRYLIEFMKSSSRGIAI